LELKTGGIEPLRHQHPVAKEKNVPGSVPDGWHKGHPAPAKRLKARVDVY
jgi:hypothetical protein